MADRKTTILNWFETELTAQMGPTDLTAEVAATAPVTSPALLVIEGDSPTQREVILFDGAYTASAFVTTDLANRYLSGSASGSGLTHPAGSSVRLVVLAQHVNDTNDRIDADRTEVTAEIDADVAAEAAAHLAAEDHHAEDHAARHAPAGGDPLPADSVVTATILDGAVTTAKLPDDAVTAAKIANNAVGSGEIADSAVTTAKINDDAVTAAKVADGVLHEEVEIQFHKTSHGSVSGTYAAVASTLISIPGHWNSWRCTIWGAFTESTGNSMTARLNIDGVITATTGAESIFHFSLTGMRTGILTTGSRTVEVQARANAADLNVGTVTMHVRAVRTS